MGLKYYSDMNDAPVSDLLLQAIIKTENQLMSLSAYSCKYHVSWKYFPTSDEQVENLTRDYNIHYSVFIGSLIYLFSTRVDLSFAVHKLANFSENPGKVHFEGLIHLLRYIRDNKTLGMK